MLFPVQIEMILEYFGLNNTQYNLQEFIDDPQRNTEREERQPESYIFPVEQDGYYLSAIINCDNNLFDQKFKNYLLHYCIKTEDREEVTQTLGRVYALGLNKLRELNLENAENLQVELTEFLSSLQKVNDLVFNNFVDLKSAIHRYFNRIGPCDDTGCPENADKIHMALTSVLQTNLEKLTAQYGVISEEEINNFQQQINRFEENQNWDGELTAQESAQELLAIELFIPGFVLNRDQDNAARILSERGYTNIQAQEVVRGLHNNILRIILSVTEVGGVIPDIRQQLLQAGPLSDEACNAIIALTTNRHNRVGLNDALQVIGIINNPAKLNLLANLVMQFGYRNDDVENLVQWTEEFFEEHSGALWPLIANRTNNVSLREGLEIIQDLFPRELDVIKVIAENKGAVAAQAYKQKFCELNVYFRKYYFEMYHANLLINLVENHISALPLETGFDIIQKFVWHNPQQKVDVINKLKAATYISSRIGAQEDLCNRLGNWQAAFNHTHTDMLVTLLTGKNKVNDVQKALEYVFASSIQANQLFVHRARVFYQIFELRDFTPLIERMDFEDIAAKLKINSQLNLDDKKFIFFNELMNSIFGLFRNQERMLRTIINADDNAIANIIMENVNRKIERHQSHEGPLFKRNRVDDREDRDPNPSLGV